MKTNYPGHDALYRQRRAAGISGWQDAASLQHALALLGSALMSEHAPTSGAALELGCGAGDLSLWLAERGYEVCGVDISPTAIDWAREKAKARGLRADFQVGDVLDLAAFPDERFDLVLDGFCLHCIIGADRSRFLTSARRVLRPGGRLYVATMCGEVTSPELLQVFDPVSRCVLDRDGVATRHVGEAADILAEIRREGFRVLDSEVRARRDVANDQDELRVWAVRA